MLDLQRLRLLRELDARGTVRGAATSLGYSASAVSQQLAVLEREAGTALLERVGRGVRLTPAGQVLVRHAAELLDRVAAAEAEVATVAAGQVAGVVRVSAFQSAFLRVVAPAVRRLAATHPDVVVHATELEVEEAAGLLELQQLDVVVGDEYEHQPRPAHPGLHRASLVREQIRVLLPADHPLAGGDGERPVDLADLAGAAWATCRPGTGQHLMSLRLCRQLGGFEPDVRYTSDDFAILVEATRTCGAVALMPDLTLHGLTDLAVRPLVGGPVGRDIFALSRRDPPPVVAVVLEALASAAAAQAGSAG